MTELRLRRELSSIRRMGTSARRVLFPSIGGISVVVLLIYLFAPALVIVCLSFSNETILRFPPAEWGFRQYEAFFSSSSWLSATWLSFEIAVPSAVLALLVGVPLMIAINRSKIRLKGLLLALGVAPLVIPGVSYAVAMYTFFAKVHLVGQTIGLVLVDATLGLPFVLLVVGGALQRVPEDLELVAMSLGASRSRAIIGITVRALVPAVIGAFILAFITSFDEAVLVVFISGPGLDTLPKSIYNSLHTGVDPLITAIATLLMVGTGLIVGIGTYLEGRR